MRVAREVAHAVERSEEESEDDLAEAVARRLVELLDLLEAEPVDPLAHEHVLAAETRDHVGDHDEWVAAPRARERSLRLRLVLVVELLGHALAALVRHRLRVETGPPPL